MKQARALQTLTYRLEHGNMASSVSSRDRPLNLGLCFFPSKFASSQSVSDNKRTDGPFSTERTVRSLIITTAQPSVNRFGWNLIHILPDPRSKVHQSFCQIGPQTACPTQLLKEKKHQPKFKGRTRQGGSLACWQACPWQIIQTQVQPLLIYSIGST